MQPAESPAAVPETAPIDTARKQDPVLEKALGHLIERAAVARQRGESWIRVDTCHLSALLAYVKRLERARRDEEREHREDALEAEGLFAEFRIRLRRLETVARRLWAMDETLVAVLRPGPPTALWRRSAWRETVAAAMRERGAVQEAYRRCATETLDWIRGEKPEALP